MQGFPKSKNASLKRAALWGGYRNLTDFVNLTLQEKAKVIIQEKEQIIASEREGTLFFDAVTHPGKAQSGIEGCTDWL